MQYKVIDGCPIPSPLFEELLELKRLTGCVYNSVYRGKDARAILNKYGKHDQEWLFLHSPPGVANPPGRSTHELRNDGVAYAGWVGMPLRYWQVGIDINDYSVARFIRAASVRGWTATVTYPTSLVEKHHVNFRKEPVFRVSKPLKLGDKGPRVKVLTRRLAFVRTPNHKGRYLSHTYWTFTKAVELALKSYQADHHQKADGIFGLQSSRQLAASTRYWKQQEAKKK